MFSYIPKHLFSNKTFGNNIIWEPVLPNFDH